MHHRISERRLAVAMAGSALERAAGTVPTSLELITFEARLADLQHKVVDDRLAECMALARSSRLIVEMNESANDRFLVLMPCAAAAVREIQTTLRQIAIEAHARVAESEAKRQREQHS